VLHEYVTPDAEESTVATTTGTGAPVAAIETPSGRVVAPDPQRAVWEPRTHAYATDPAVAREAAAFRLDGDTTRPDVLAYHDPFSPSVAPFKRQFVMDAVLPELQLGVSVATLLPLSVGGDVRSNEDQFFADLVVELAADTPVRIPSAGPGARVLSAQLGGDGRFGIYRDLADNWFITASRTGRARLVLRQAVPREAFSPEIADVDWAELPRPPAMPAAAAAAAARVVSALGIDRAARPARVLRQLVAHFRSFQPSEQLPVSLDEVSLYEEIALSKKGVCRHRAFAFLVTAQSLGIATRFVHNEAHAWVEVSDGRLWHRIDLGGAAGRLDTVESTNAPPYRAPPDPFGWPPTAHSGVGLAAPAPSGGAPAVTPSATPSAAPTGASGADPRPPTVVELLPFPQRKLTRGASLELRGRALGRGAACGSQRLDVVGFSSSGTVPLGALAAADDGSFQGTITLRLDMPVGDYDVRVLARGNLRCGPSEP
jgi:transglutaminase-like putative cysteine protease